ncbi:MAG: hypothetical protein AAB388_02955 [Patescibacteria group bacterium]
MTENFESIEGKKERIPSEEEVFNKFKEILGDREFTEMQKIEDEGVYIWDIKTLDETGDEMDISYQRGRTFQSGVVTHSRITQTLYTPDGVPCGAGAQYDYVDGQWEERL